MSDRKHVDILHNVRQGSKCPMVWDDMEGEAPFKQCSRCKMTVICAEDMSQDELTERLQKVKSLSRLSTNDLLYRRGDGTLTMKDCHGGRRPIVASVIFVAPAVAVYAFISLFSGLTLAEFFEFYPWLLVLPLLWHLYGCSRIYTIDEDLSWWTVLKYSSPLVIIGLLIALSIGYFQWSGQ